MLVDRTIQNPIRIIGTLRVMYTTWISQIKIPHASISEEIAQVIWRYRDPNSEGIPRTP
jgi:hypothetical protein